MNRIKMNSPKSRTSILVSLIIINSTKAIKLKIKEFAIKASGSFCLFNSRNDFTCMVYTYSLE